MRRLLGRVGVAGGLLALVAVIVIVARLIGGGAAPPHISTGSQPAYTFDPSAADDGPTGIAQPTAGPDDAVIIQTALDFMAAWLDTNLSTDEWRAALVPVSTQELADKLTGVDPLSVPASRTAGDATIPTRSAVFAQVSIPVDSGTVTLGLFKQNDRWLVGTVDWDRE